MSTEPGKEPIPASGDPVGEKPDVPMLRTHEPSPTAPSRRLQEYLIKAKASRIEAETTNRTADTKDSNHGKSSREAHSKNAHGTSSKATVKVCKKHLGTTEDATPTQAASLPDMPSKPEDWGKHEPVSADQQQPPKQRGRKPKQKNDCKDKPQQKKAPKRKSKASKAVSPEASKDIAAEALPTGKAAKKAKIDKKATLYYEPLEPEGDINTDKGAAFDAYAAASASADASRLGEQSASTGTGGRRRKGSTAAAAKSKAKDKGEEHKPNKPSCKATPKPKGRSSKTTRMAGDNSPDGESSKKKPQRTSKKDCKDASTKQKSPEYKAKLSRKSCAYKKAFNEAKKAGVEENAAREIAKKVASMLGNILIYSTHSSLFFDSCTLGVGDVVESACSVLGCSNLGICGLRVNVYAGGCALC